MANVLLMAYVQSAGTDAAVNLWLASPPSNAELTPNRSLSSFLHYFLLDLYSSKLCSCFPLTIFIFTAWLKPLVNGQSPCSIHTVIMKTLYMVISFHICFLSFLDSIEL